MADKGADGEADGMPSAKRTLHVDAPRQRVWDFATDPRNLTAYVHGAQRVEPITTHRHGVGAQWRQTNVYGPLVVVNVYEVTEADAPNRWVLETTTRPHTLFSLELRDADDERTEATLEITAEVPGGAADRPEGPHVGGWAVESIARRTLETLKRKVERQERRRAEREREARHEPS